MYREWTDICPGEIEVVGVRYPGRENLMRQPPITDLHQLAAALKVAIEPLFDRPFVFFGHSMGAWVAFELARQLQTTTVSGPAVLFVSARRAPQVPERHSQLHNLNDDELVDGIQNRFGGIPDEVRAEPELLKMMLPTLRADLQVLEAYEFQSDQMLECPIHAFGGDQDSQVTMADLDAWQERTTAEFDRQCLPGSHFFIHEAEGPALRARLAQIISRNLELGRTLC